MPDDAVWTPARDAELTRLQGTALDWDGIAAALGVTRTEALERARALSRRRRTAEDGPTGTEVDAARGYGGYGSLPAGHATTWEAATAGTTLDGAPFRRILTMRLTAEATLSLASGEEVVVATGPSKATMRVAVLNTKNPQVLNMTAEEGRVLCLLIDRAQRDCR